MPQYVMRDIPTDLWARFTSRARAQGWPLRPLFFQMMSDYASGHDLSAPPPRPMQQYAWLRPFWRRLARFVSDSPIEAQWEALVQEVEALRPHQATGLREEPDDTRAEILAWLGETSKDPRPGPNKLSMRAIAHIGSGPSLSENRRAFQYEVQGMAPGQQAFIAQFPGQGWNLLRVIDGRQDKAWRGHHGTAEDALRALEAELYLEEDHPGDTEQS